MPKIRSIHPDACDSEKLVPLSDGAERTLWRLTTHSDDAGRGVDNPKLLASKLYPLHDDKTGGVLDGHLDELAAAGMLVRYEVGGKRYYEVHDFEDWQKPRHKTDSKLPPPTEGNTRTSDDPPTDDTGTSDTRPTPAAEQHHGDGGVIGGGDGDVIAPAKPTRNAIFETLVEVCGWDTSALTKSARGRANKAAKELDEIGATPEGIRARAQVHRSKWPDMSVTPTSIAANYAELGKSSAPPSAEDSAAVRTYDREDAEARFRALTGEVKAS